MRKDPTLVTLLVSFGWVVLALGLQFALLPDLDVTPFYYSFFLAVFLPLAVGGSIFLFFRPMLQELAGLRQRYAHAISHDSLTACLNGTVFSAMVDTFSVPGTHWNEGRGAFLAVDIQGLGAINSRSGYQAGNQALRHVAEIIQASVRKNDLVGRIGGGEFGVFLPGASLENAEAVAERIRQQVAESDSSANEDTRGLSIGLAGVIFEQQIGFNELARVAEQALRRAKHKGPNSVEYVQLGTGDLPPPSLH